jgi:Leucine-rich repeat (LRR) protein
VHSGLILIRRLALLTATLALAGCSEGPPTRAELDAIAAMQRVRGQVDTNSDGHAVKLILAGSDVRDEELAPVAELHDLTFLSLERTPIGDAGLAYLSGLTDLNSLSLAGTKVTDKGLAYLAKLSSLENLDLEGTAITDRGLAELAPITSLRKVYVSRAGGPTTRGIDNLETANPRLHVTRQ